MKNALIYLIVFAALQILVESVLQLISTQVLAEPLSVVNITIMSMSLSGVIILCLFVKLRWAEVSPAYLRSRQWGGLVWGALAGDYDRCDEGAVGIYGGGSVCTDSRGTGL